MNKKATMVVIGLVVATLLVIGVVYALTKQNTPVSDNQSTDNSSQTSSNTKSDATPALTIVFTDNGFEKSDYSVKSGQVVEVKNNSSRSLQFSSDSHPTHTDETELNLAVLAPGESAQFTPTRVGHWGFHDHLDHTLTGVLNVE